MRQRKAKQVRTKDDKGSLEIRRLLKLKKFKLELMDVSVSSLIASPDGSRISSPVPRPRKTTAEHIDGSSKRTVDSIEYAISSETCK